MSLGAAGRPLRLEPSPRNRGLSKLLASSRVLNGTPKVARCHCFPLTASSCAHGVTAKRCGTKLTLCVMKRLVTALWDEMPFARAEPDYGAHNPRTVMVMA